jgi:hypothetical protein
VAVCIPADETTISMETPIGTTMEIETAQMVLEDSTKIVAAPEIDMRVTLVAMTVAVLETDARISVETPIGKMHGKTRHNFTTIQVRHGEYVSVDELRYLDCPFVNNEVVDLSYSTMHVDHPIKGYSLKVPYGMVSKSNENGNALLMWYEKKAQ